MEVGFAHIQYMYIDMDGHFRRDPPFNAYFNMYKVYTQYVSLRIDFRGETYRGSRKAKKTLLNPAGISGRNVTMVIEYELRYSVQILSIFN